MEQKPEKWNKNLQNSTKRPKLCKTGVKVAILNKNHKRNKKESEMT